jgi:acetoin utilization protein AcuB
MFLLAVNGNYEPFVPRFDRPSMRVAKGPPIGQTMEEGAPVPPPVRRTASQHAYAQTRDNRSERKPATLAQDIMKTPVMGITAETTVADAWTLMRTHGFRHMPVISGDQMLIGIVSDRDLLRYANILERGERGTLPASVNQIMTTRVLAATAASDIREVAQVMLLERISAMPIIDEMRRPVGMVTVTDILRAIVNRAPLELWS